MCTHPLSPTFSPSSLPSLSPLSTCLTFPLGITTCLTVLSVLELTHTRPSWDLVLQRPLLDWTVDWTHFTAHSSFPLAISSFPSLEQVSSRLFTFKSTSPVCTPPTVVLISTPFRLVFLSLTQSQLSLSPSACTRLQVGLSNTCT